MSSSGGGQRGMAPGLPMAGGFQEVSLQAEFHPLCLIQQVVLQGSSPALTPFSTHEEVPGRQQAHGRVPGGTHTARPRASRGRMGGSRAQRCNKALIAISRHLAFFYVQFILEASIVSEAK